MDRYLEKRIWEIDSLRGIGIIMMLVSNLITDLNYFNDRGGIVKSDFWGYFAIMTATIFIFLVGVSLTLSYSRAKKHKTKKELRMKYLKRGLKIFSWGFVITLVTWIFLREGFVIFGILHLIGISIILTYPFIKYRFWNLLLGIFFISFGIYLRNFTFDRYWLVWLGFIPPSFYSVDHFPIFPWLGIVLIGLFFGNLLYHNCTRRVDPPDLSRFSFIRLLCFLGRHSLLIYLIHQPIIVILLHVSGIIHVSFL